jgi:hypothetical protein
MKNDQSCFCVVVLRAIRVSHEFEIFRDDDGDEDGDRGQVLRWG